MKSNKEGFIIIAIDYLKNSKDKYYQLFNRYNKAKNKEEGLLIEPVVSVIYDYGERQVVFCHPEDEKFISLSSFEHEYALI